MRRRNVRVEEENCYKKWTNEEDALLVRQVRAFPQNLSRCFLIVAESTGRSQKAVQAHWYTKVSKKPENMCFFTASPKHVSKNRKNGMGVSTTESLWRRLIRLISNI
jgi:hypothetical protein